MQRKEKKTEAVDMLPVLYKQMVFIGKFCKGKETISIEYVVVWKVNVKLHIFK
jgi:hypothetical protein